VGAINASTERTKKTTVTTKQQGGIEGGGILGVKNRGKIDAGRVMGAISNP